MMVLFPAISLLLWLQVVHPCHLGAELPKRLRSRGVLRPVLRLRLQGSARGGTREWRRGGRRRSESQAAAQHFAFGRRVTVNSYAASGERSPTDKETVPRWCTTHPPTAVRELSVSIAHTLTAGPVMPDQPLGPQ